MTQDFLQPKQFTRSFNSSSEKMTYLLEIQRNQYFFTQWLKWHNIFSITGIIYIKHQTSIKILNLYLLQNFKHFLLCIFSYQADIILVNIECLRYQSKSHLLRNAFDQNFWRILTSTYSLVIDVDSCFSWGRNNNNLLSISSTLFYRQPCDFELRILKR